MIGTGAISFVGAASQLVIMVVLGIPLALPVFVLSFFLCFIPYIGGLRLDGDRASWSRSRSASPVDIAVMIVWTLVFNIVTGNIVTPLVYGRMVHLHPAVVLVAIPAARPSPACSACSSSCPAMAVVASTWRTVLAVIGTDRKPVRLRAEPPDLEARPAVPDTPAASPEPA